MKRRYIIGALGAVLLAGASYVYSESRSVSVEDLGACVNGTVNDKAMACIRTRSRALLKDTPAHELMKRVETEFPTKCHIIGHIVGQETYRMSESSESAFASCAPASCVHACTHGVIGEVLLSASGITGSPEEWEHPSLDMLRAEGERLCSNVTTCHATGHVYFLIFNDLEKALAACDEIASHDPHACYGGVFMENGAAMFARVLPDGPREEKNYRDPSDILSPCHSVAERYQPACFRFLYVNQPRTFREREIMDEKERFRMQTEACATLAPSLNRIACFKGVGWSLRFAAPSTFAAAREACGSIVEREDRMACLFGIADSYSDNGTSPRDVMFECAKAGDEADERACYQGLFNALSDREHGLLASACDGASFDVCADALSAFIADHASE